VANLVLINGILNFVDDLDLRLHHRSQMEAAGLRHITEACQRFHHPVLDKQLQFLQTTLDEDELRLRERLDKAILQDLNNPQDVYNAIQAKMGNTRAKDFFLSMMQHLLLIREEGDAMVHYYQLLDSIVTDVVLDKKLAGAEQRLGHSVERIIAQFNEADRLQVAEDEAAELRARALQMRLEKEALEEELAKGQDGLVGQLKERLIQVEQKLSVSRETTSRLQGQLETQKAGYEEQIAQLEAQIMELFRMLKEVDKGVETILDSGSVDRKTLVATLEKHFQHNETISILEGRDRRRRKRGAKSAGETEDISETDEDRDATPGKSSLLRKRRQKTKTAAELQRSSQFMDADDAAAQEQIQQQLADGPKIVSLFSALLFYVGG
jgi:cytokinesis protein